MEAHFNTPISDDRAPAGCPASRCLAAAAAADAAAVSACSMLLIGVVVDPAVHASAKYVLMLSK